MLTESESFEFLLKDQDVKNIPLDAFFDYAKNIWEAIENNKEINIPDQKSIVSYFKCNQLKEEEIQEC